MQVKYAVWCQEKYVGSLVYAGRTQAIFNKREDAEQLKLQMELDKLEDWSATYHVVTLNIEE